MALINGLIKMLRSILVFFDTQSWINKDHENVGTSIIEISSDSEMMPLWKLAAN